MEIVKRNVRLEIITQERWGCLSSLPTGPTSCKTENLLPVYTYMQKGCMHSCIGFTCYGFGRKGPISACQCEKMSKASLLPDRVSTSWLQDRPAAEPINNGGRTSGVPRLKKKINCCTTAAARGVRTCWEEVVHTTRSVEKEGKKVLNMLDSPAGDGADYSSCAPAAQGGPWWGRDPPAAYAGPNAGASACLVEDVTLCKTALEQASDRTCDPMEWGVHAGNRFTVRSCCPTEDSVRISLHFMILDCTPWNGLMLKQFVEKWTLSNGPTLEKFVKECLHWGRRKKWGERSCGDNVWWTDHSPHSLSSCIIQREEVGKSGRNSGKKGGVGASFISHYPTLTSVWQ